MIVTFTLTKREAEAVLRSSLSVGEGVPRPQVLVLAELKLRQAVQRALSDRPA